MKPTPIRNSPPRSVAAVLTVLLTLFALWATPGATAQQVVYVNAAAAPGGNGQSWATAFDNLQTALVTGEAAILAGGSAEVWIAAGTYVPNQPGGFSLASRVRLYGGFNGSESTRDQRRPADNLTVLSGDVLGNDLPGFANRGDNLAVVVSASGCDQTAILDGFLIRGGNNVQSSDPGAGLRIQGASPRIVNCTFFANRSGMGAGSSVSGASTPTFVSCRYIGNHNFVRGAAFESGVGVASRYHGCAFIANTCESDGAGFANEFSAVSSLVNCTFTENACTLGGGCGGAISSGVSAVVNATNCILWSNRRSSTPGAGPADQAYFADGSSFNLATSCLQGGSAGVRLTNGAAVDFPAGNVTSDPLFAGVPGTDTALGTLDDNVSVMAPSPMIDTGTHVFPPYPDLRGFARTADGNSDGIARPDMGAAEHGAEGTKPRLYVRPTSSGLGAGASWSTALEGSAGLKTALAEASAAAGLFDGIWVAAGTYAPSPPLSDDGSRSDHFSVGHDAAMFGGFSGNETELTQRILGSNPTVLSGDLNGDDDGDQNRLDNANNVVICSTSNLSPATIDGFTIRAGREDSPLNSFGAGLLLSDSSDLLLRNCRFVDNRAVNGGAVVAVYRADAVVEDCLFEQNTANDAGGAFFAHAYGVAGTTTFKRCLFRDNNAARGGAIYLGGQQLFGTESYNIVAVEGLFER
ncbi:MAG: right-handed parallel beta-helix repeat-containing protein, partial [Phycisphaerales bacterium]